MNAGNVLPSPWTIYGGDVQDAENSTFSIEDGDGGLVAYGLYRPEAEFICLARKAFDVLQEHSLLTVWRDLDGLYRCEMKEVGYPDPFTAITEAVFHEPQPETQPDDGSPLWKEET